MKRHFAIPLVVLSLAGTGCNHVFGQDASSTPSSPRQAKSEKDASAPKVANPFESPITTEAEMMGMTMEFGMEMEDMEMGGMMGMMDMSAEEPTANQRFRQGLQRAIVSLKKATTEQEQATIRGYVRDALAQRYETMIRDRKRELERLKQSVAKLESDLQRREAAKERVVQVQMQSVQLAAEGLLELTELQGVSPSRAGGGEGAGYGDDYGQ